MALLPPNNGGDGGVSDHRLLAGRDQPNQHPVSAITGLQDWLEGHNQALAVALSLRFIYQFVNTTSQVITLQQPIDSLSLVVAVVRASDGALIEPEVTYGYGPGPMRYIERITLGFTPGITGEFIVHVVR